MLADYFSLTISESGLVMSLPLLLRDYIPNLDNLPSFLMRLGPQVFLFVRLISSRYLILLFLTRSTGHQKPTVSRRSYASWLTSTFLPPHPPKTRRISIRQKNGRSSTSCSQPCAGIWYLQSRFLTEILFRWQICLIFIKYSNGVKQRKRLILYRLAIGPQFNQ